MFCIGNCSSKTRQDLGADAMHTREIADGTYSSYRIVNFEARSRMEVVWLVMHRHSWANQSKECKVKKSVQESKNRLLRDMECHLIVLWHAAARILHGV